MNCYDEFSIVTVVVHYSDEAAVAQGRNQAEAVRGGVSNLRDHDNTFYTDVDAITEQLLMEDV